ncbi:MAG: hypothetical protein JXA42_04915 [Anaerolineales bacterium]|nr:hypothetical protein [Anaerolineales bacterium]
MLTTVQGMYRAGKIELVETPPDIPEDTPVIITFLEPINIDLLSRDIYVEQASDLRNRLASFTEEWDSPEMEIYDNYDISKANLQTR